MHAIDRFAAFFFSFQNSMLRLSAKHIKNDDFSSIVQLHITLTHYLRLPLKIVNVRSRYRQIKSARSNGIDILFILEESLSSFEDDATSELVLYNFIT